MLRSERTWLGPTATQRLALLRRAKSIAIVGFSTNPTRSSYFVGTYLVQSSDYTVYFVNPNAAGGTALGRPIYASLADLPETPDIVDVFRKAADIPRVVEDVIDCTPTDHELPASWVQLGIWNESAAYEAEEKGSTVVMDRCLKVEHARFHGGLRLFSFPFENLIALENLVVGPMIRQPGFCPGYWGCAGISPFLGWVRE